MASRVWDMEHSLREVMRKHDGFLCSQLCYVWDVIRKSAIIETTNCTPDHTPSHFSLSTEDCGPWLLSLLGAPSSSTVLLRSPPGSSARSPTSNKKIQ